MTSLLDFTKENIVSRQYEWAWNNYKDIVLRLQKNFSSNSLLEIGAGRDPLFAQREVDSAGFAYTANDISPGELSRAPDWCQKAVFDICTPPTAAFSTYDLIFSKMVFEHIEDAQKAYRATFNLLKPDGIALTFCSTLYCMPFLINYLVPNGLSTRLQTTFARRPAPKFPAYYSWCRSSEKVKADLQNIGFRSVHIAPFYGHPYYRLIPILRECEEMWRSPISNRDFRILSSFAYILLQK